MRVMRLLKPCTTVVLRCVSGVDADFIRRNFSLHAVSPGMRIGTYCTVVSVEAGELDDECYISASTKFTVMNPGVFKVLEETNEAVVLDAGSEVVVYSADVYRQLLELELKPILNGESPLNHGILLVGPPGTGKTTLINLLAKGLGFYTVRIRPDDVYSKYLGESEQRLRERLNECERNQPCLMILDDGEWLFLGRSLVVERAISSGEWRYSLINIVLDFMTRVHEENKRILIVASTNVAPEIIDPAIQREGRFGEPLVLTPPSYTMWQLWLRHALEKDSYEWLRKLIQEKGRGYVESVLREAAATGQSPTEVVNWLLAEARGIKRRKPPSVGYARIAAPQAPQNPALECFFNNVISPVVKRSGKVMLRIPTAVERQAPLLEAVAAAYLAWAGTYAIKPIIASKIGEAIAMATLLNVPFIVTVPETVAMASMDLKMSKIPVLVLTPLPAEYAVGFVDLDVNMQYLSRCTQPMGELLAGILESTCIYYNVSYKPEEIRKMREKLTYTTLANAAYLASAREYASLTELMADVDRITGRLAL